MDLMNVCLFVLGCLAMIWAVIGVLSMSESPHVCWRLGNIALINEDSVTLDNGNGWSRVEGVPRDKGDVLFKCSFTNLLGEQTYLTAR